MSKLRMQSRTEPRCPPSQWYHCKRIAEVAAAAVVAGVAVAVAVAGKSI